MSNLPRRLLPFLFAGTLASCCLITQTVTTTHQPLSYVGTITLGTPVSSGSQTTVPVSFSGGEWMRNSGICLRSINATSKGADVEIWVNTCLGGKPAAVPEFSVKGAQPGPHRVFYRNPDGTTRPIGEVVFP